MTDSEFIDRLVDTLRSMPGFGTAPDHVVTNCPICERERDSTEKGHYYINITKPNHPSDCKKCNGKFGKLSDSLLVNIGVDDSNIIKYAKDNFKQTRSYTQAMAGRLQKLSFKIPTKLNPRYLDKLEYMKRRLQKDFSNEEDLKKFKIIPSIKSFIKVNNIDIETIDPYLKKDLNMYDDCYIGFLSVFGNKIYFRRVVDDDSIPKHRILSVSNLVQRAFTYAPTMTIDPLAEEPKIVLVEGVFDLIGLMLIRGESDDTVYYTCNSRGSFRTTLNLALELTCFYGATILPYLDNDDYVKKINRLDYSLIVDSFRGYGYPFTVIINVNVASNDYGDFRKEIDIQSKDITSQLSKF